MQIEPAVGADSSAVQDHSSRAAPQAGVLNTPPDHLLIGAFALTGADAPTNRQIVEDMRDLIRRELKSDLDELAPNAPKDQPTAETGEIGFSDHFDRYHLTVTVGFSSSAYEKLGVAADDGPQDLIPIPWSQLGDTPDQPDSADIAVMACGDSLYILEHVDALRRKLGVQHQRQIWTAFRRRCGVDPVSL